MRTSGSTGSARSPTREAVTTLAVASPPSGVQHALRHHRSPALLPGRLGRYCVRDRRRARRADRDRGSRHLAPRRSLARRVAHRRRDRRGLGIDVRFYQAGTDLASPFTFSFIVAALALWAALRRSWRELAGVRGGALDRRRRPGPAQARDQPHDRGPQQRLVPVRALVGDDGLGRPRDPPRAAGLPRPLCRGSAS